MLCQTVAPRMEGNKRIKLQQSAAKISIVAQKIAETTQLMQKAPEDMTLYQQLSSFLAELGDTFISVGSMLPEDSLNIVPEYKFNDQLRRLQDRYDPRKRLQSLQRFSSDTGLYDMRAIEKAAVLDHAREIRSAVLNQMKTMEPKIKSEHTLHTPLT